MSHRLQGWDRRLSDFIQSKRKEPFIRGVNDCAIFCGECLEAMSGEDYTSEFKNPYKTKREAFEMLKSLGYKTLSDIADKKVGNPMKNTSFAKRGDVVLIKVGDEEALGVIDLSGKMAVTFTKEGLKQYKPDFWVKAWSFS